MMKNRDKFEKKTWKIHVPVLRLRYRILLYLLTLVFAVVSLFNVVTEHFSDAIGIVFYALAGCTLFASSYYLAVNIKHSINKKIKSAILTNPLASKMAAEYRFRTIVFTVPGTISNILFALFNGIVGIISHSAWFGSLAAYYILLSIMRVSIVNKEIQILQIKDTKTRRNEEITVYQMNSVLFILMAVTLAGMVILLEFSLGGKSYPGLTIYAAATYTFYRIILSSINVIKVKKRQSPLLTIIRKIGWIDACISILTLQTAMFVSFHDGEGAFTKIMNAVTGAVVCMLVLGMGIQGLRAAKKMKCKESKEVMG